MLKATLTDVEEPIRVTADKCVSLSTVLLSRRALESSF